MTALPTSARVVAAGLALAVVVAGCAEDGGPAAGPAPEDLDGQWTLVDATGPAGPIGIVDDHRPTLVIDGDEWGGNVCNHYGATVSVAGAAVTIDELFATEMACPDAGVMESEAAYLDALARVERVEVADSRLVLSGDEVELVYEPVAPEPDAPLTGTVWRLESLVHGTGPDSAVSQARTAEELVFGDDGTLQAATGCRWIAGPYHLDANLLDLTEVGADDPECADVGLVDQDDHIRATLLSGTAIRYRIDGSRLELQAPTGPGLHYRAVPSL